MNRLSTVPIVIALFCGPAASAAPVTDHFDALRTELAARVDAGALDARQERAADKALAAMDAPSTSIAIDVRTAGKVLKRLARPFAGEIAAETGIGALTEGLKAALIADVMGEVAALEAATSGLPDDTCRGRVDAAVRRATDRVAAAEGAANPAAILARALRMVAKGTAKAGKCEPANSVTTTTSTTSTTAAAGSTTTTVDGATCGANVLTVSVDGSPFSPETAYFHRGDDVQSVVVTGSANSPGYSEVSMVAWNVTGLGTFAVQEFSTWVENGDTTFFAGSTYTVSGTLTVTKLVSGPTACVAGSFDVTFTAADRVRHLTGTYDLTNTF